MVRDSWDAPLPLPSTPLPLLCWLAPNASLRCIRLCSPSDSYVKSHTPSPTVLLAARLLPVRSVKLPSALLAAAIPTAVDGTCLLLLLHGAVESVGVLHEGNWQVKSIEYSGNPKTNSTRTSQASRRRLQRTATFD
jgi:hypothetical protein